MLRSRQLPPACAEDLMNGEGHSMTATDVLVPETNFGKWFVRTDMWVQRVLAVSFLEFDGLFDSKQRFSRILDIGCGEGTAFALIEKHLRPQMLIGIDIDARAVRRAQDAARKCGCRAEVRVGDAARLELPDSSMDLIVCHQTLHHLTNQRAAVRELYRVLVPGGVLLCAESCRCFIESFWVRWLFRHPPEVQKSAGEYLELVRSVGFEFGSENYSTPYPAWSRPDFGLSELFGRSKPVNGEEPLIYVAAFRPRSA